MNRAQLIRICLDSGVVRRDVAIKLIDTISRDNGELFEGDDKNKLIQSMMVTHDWFAKPSQWFDKR